MSIGIQTAALYKTFEEDRNALLQELEAVDARRFSSERDAVELLKRLKETQKILVRNPYSNAVVVIVISK